MRLEVLLLAHRLIPVVALGPATRTTTPRRRNPIPTGYRVIAPPKRRDFFLAADPLPPPMYEPPNVDVLDLTLRANRPCAVTFGLAGDRWRLSYHPAPTPRLFLSPTRRGTSPTEAIVHVVERGARRPGARTLTALPGYADLPSSVRSAVQRFLEIVGAAIKARPALRSRRVIEPRLAIAVGTPNPEALLAAFQTSLATLLADADGEHVN